LREDREDVGLFTRLVLEIVGSIRRLKGGVVEDEKTPTTSEAEEVEGHLLRDRPGTERPGTEAQDEGPEVEGHSLRDRPGTERPGTEANDEGPDVELHGLTERPGTERPGTE
jgi:hypothetical protein